MKWLRLYNETPNDPKLRVIAAETGQNPGIVLAVWTAMLCHASDQPGEERGTLAGWRDIICAAQLGFPLNTVSAIRQAMDGLMLSGDCIVAWDRRASRPAPRVGSPTTDLGRPNGARPPAPGPKAG